MSQLILAINLAIDSGDNILLGRLLEKLPLKFMKQETSNILLESFVTFAYLNNRSKCVSVIFDRWSQDNPEETTFSTPVLLFTFCDNIDVLQYVINALPKQPLEYFYELINNDASPENYEACRRITQAIPPQNSRFWRALLKYIKQQFEESDQGNYIIRDFVIRELEHISKYRSKPEWVRDYGLNSGALRYDDRVIFELPSANDAAKMMVVIPNAMKRDIRKARMNFASEYTTSTREEKISRMMPYFTFKTRKSLENNIDMFRIMGPVNRMVNDKLNREDFCSKYGGCRMLTCIHFETQEDDEIDSLNLEDILYWFRGACDNCHHRIRRSEYAVRLPLALGGWQGCYCSWKCVRDGSILDELIKLRMLLAEQQIAKIGIQERTWELDITS